MLALTTRFLAASLAWAAVAFAQPSHAAIIATGGNIPTDPAWWANGGDSGTYGYIGVNGDVGALSVTGGSILNARTFLLGSFDGTGTATVSGGFVNAFAGDGVVVGNGGGPSSLLVDGGGSVTSPAGTIGWNSDSNSVTLTGQGSQWIDSGDLRLGNSSNNNNLTVEHDALVKVGGALSFYNLDGYGGNVVRLNGGYLALFGNVDTDSAFKADIEGDITSGYFQFWKESAWITATRADLSISSYTSDGDALAATGYEGLGGYTVITTTPVPEIDPAGMGSVLALVSGSLGLLERRRLRTG